MVEVLLQHGFSINEPNQAGDTALHLAVMKDNQALVEALVEEPDCIIDQINAKGFTALQEAVWKCNRAIVNVLLKQ